MRFVYFLVKSGYFGRIFGWGRFFLYFLGGGNRENGFSTQMTQMGQIFTD